MVNENPMDKLIRELRQENERLKKMFESGGMPTDVGGAGMSMSFYLRLLLYFSGTYIGLCLCNNVWIFKKLSF